MVIAATMIRRKAIQFWNCGVDHIIQFWDSLRRAIAARIQASPTRFIMIVIIPAPRDFWF